MNAVRLLAIAVALASQASDQTIDVSGAIQDATLEARRILQEGTADVGPDGATSDQASATIYRQGFRDLQTVEGTLIDSRILVTITAMSDVSS